jgi:PAS domain S-box-containing protein
MMKKEKISKAKSPETVKKRKKAKDELHESDELFRNFMENAPDGVFICDFNGTFLYGNRRSEKIIGYSREELIGKNLLESNLLTEKGLKKALQWLHENMKGNPTGPDEIELISKEGRIIPVEIHTSVVQHMGQETILAFVRDITQRKKSEEMIRQGEEKYRTILESFQEGYFEVDLKGNFTFCNDSMSRIIGYSKEELLGMNYRVYEDEETRKIIYQEFNKVYTTGEPCKGFDHPYINKDGIKTYVETSVILQKDSSGKPTGFKGMVRDITERKEVERKLMNSEEKFRMLAESCSFGIGMHQGDRWIYANRAAEDISGYTQEELFSMHFWDFVHPDYQEMVKQNAYNRQMGKILPRDYDFKIIAKNGTEKWVNLTGNHIKYEDKPTAVVSVTDITERKHAEEKLQQTLESLRKAVVTTVQVLVSAIETRDTYTAGHQSRSANLACAIAIEMGLAQEKIEGIQMAGIIHDIGKLSIPGEILSKSTKLKEIEFSLIKQHSRSGYEMLKNVESPWPLAEIVYQHHERMNGTGYPRNLKGDEILMESRILAVADVIEAMASHRPYRPTLGIEAALDEIEKNKGILYDDAVVNACLRLFREKGYQLK